MRQKTARYWLDRLAHGSPGVRRAAAVKLGSATPADGFAIEELIEAMRDGTDDQRFCAVEALRQLRASSDAAVRALCASLRDPLPAVRQAAVAALGAAGAESALAELALAFEREGALIRAEIVRQLSKLGTGPLLLGLLGTALYDPEYRVRYEAVMTSRNLGVGAAPLLPTLERLAREGETDLLRGQAEVAVRLARG